MVLCWTRSNLPPCVTRNSPCRNYFHRSTYQVFPRQSMTLLSMSHCFSAISSQVSGLQEKKIRRSWLCSRLVLSWHGEALEICPLLQHEYWKLCIFRSDGTKVPSKKNIAPSFNNTQPSGTYHSEFSRPKGVVGSHVTSYTVAWPASHSFPLPSLSPL